MRIIIALILSLAASISFAASPEEARDFVRGISDKTLEIVTSKTISPAEKENELEKMFNAAVDTNWIARFVLGQYWNSATDEQKAKYTELYRKFLFNNYLPNFKEYTGQKFELKNLLDEGDGEYLVQTEINNPNAASIRVDYKVRQKDGAYVIYDIIGEGISLITTQRSEFSSILSRQGIDVLIEKLEAKAASRA